MRIIPVDHSKELTAALLNYLQLSILPGDEPYPMRGHWWVAYDGTQPVGFAAVSQAQGWDEAGYLCRSGVMPSHRGRGLQKRLIRVRERKAKTLGWDWLITDTHKNPASSNSLISCGFRMYLPNKPWSFDGAVYWRKRITTNKES